MVFFGRRRHAAAVVETTPVVENKNCEPLPDIPCSSASQLNITEEQRDALIEIMRSFPEKICDARFGEHFFLRFLKARCFHVEKSKVMLREYFRWRDAFEVDRIVAHEQFPIAAQVKEYYPHGYHGVDREGRPVYIEQLGKVDVGKVLKLTNSKALCEYFVQEYEHLVEVILPCCSLQRGARVNQTLTILDLKGLSMMHHFTKQTRQLLKEIMGVSQNYYPELLGRMVIVNAPSYFTLVWNFVKPLLCEKTVTKISFGRDRVFDFVDRDQIPDFLGGTHTSTEWYLSRVGPWTDLSIVSKVRKIQTHVPSNLYLMSLMPEDVNALVEPSEGETLDESLELESLLVRTDPVDCAT